MNVEGRKSDYVSFDKAGNVALSELIVNINIIVLKLSVLRKCNLICTGIYVDQYMYYIVYMFIKFIFIYFL